MSVLVWTEKVQLSEQELRALLHLIGDKDQHLRQRIKKALLQIELRKSRFKS